jgi:hypothetical protein
MPHPSGRKVLKFLFCPWRFAKFQGVSSAKLGLAFALLFTTLHEEYTMSPVQLLGILAFATGAGLLLSEPVLGEHLLAKLTGLQIVSLRIACAITVALGALAIGLNMQEKREFRQHEKGSASDGKSPREA